MDNKKNPKKPSITITKREPGKAQKTDFMRNLRPFPSPDSHPVEDLLGLNNNPENLDAQKEIPLDTQNVTNLGTQTNQSLDNQTAAPVTPKEGNFEQPNEIVLDTQNFPTGTPETKTFERPNENLLDTQTENFGHSKTESLSAGAPKSEIPAPKKAEDPGVQTPKKENLDTQKNQKGKYDYRKYEAARSTVRVNLHIDKEIDKKVRQYCLVDSDPKMDLKDFYETAAVRFLDHLGTQKEQGLGAGAPYDDRRSMMLYKTRPSIINLHLAYTAAYNEIAGKNSPVRWKAKWTSKDDELGLKFNETDFRVVELGILQTQVNKGFEPDGSKIQTFKYYVDEIEKVQLSGISEQMLETILQYHRQMWKSLTKREVDLSFLEKHR